MFVYYQRTGRFLHRSGNGTRLLATGYAGAAACINDPEKDHVRQCGPIPKGSYRLRVLEHPRFAAPAIFCEPEAGTEMHGRSGFFIHGDNRNGNRTASTGCIILSRLIRSQVARWIASGDDRLVVLGDVEGTEAVERPYPNAGSMVDPLGAPVELAPDRVLVSARPAGSERRLAGV